MMFLRGVLQLKLYDLLRKNYSRTGVMLIHPPCLHRSGATEMCIDHKFKWKKSAGGNPFNNKPPYVTYVLGHLTWESAECLKQTHLQRKLRMYGCRRDFLKDTTYKWVRNSVQAGANQPLV